MRSLSHSTGNPPRLIALLVEKWRVICVLGHLVTGLYLACIILPDYNERTRISENALLPALVTEHFSQYQRIAFFAKGLLSHSDMQEYVKAQLQEHGITAQSQSYHTVLPKYNVSGSNVYGLVRASRSPAVEAILVAVSLNRDNVEALAMCLALATFCREQLYWARDVLFVFVDGNTIGMEAFLAAYHGVPRNYIQFDRLHYHGGSIIGAFAVEVRGTTFSKLNVKFNMVNGLLPNLDLVNLMVRLADKFDLRPTVYEHGQQTVWWDVAETSAKAAFSQAFINTEGLHSVFGSYGIQAVTIEAISGNSDGYASLTEIARICEGALRSLNNILEKFHQSYFLYFLPNSRRFISVAYYMPPVGFILSPLLVLALRDWFAMVELDVASSYIYLHFIGCALYSLTKAFSISHQFYDGVYISTLLMFFPFYMLFPIEKRNVISTRFLFYLELSLVLGALSLLNFSLAIIIALICVPIVIGFSTVQSRKYNQIKGIAGFAIHPFVIFVTCKMFISEPSKSAIEIGYSLLNSALKSHLLYGSFHFPFVCISLIPLWNILIQFSRLYDS